MRVLRRKKRPTRGSAADVGVRPTICADVRKWENYAALGNLARCFCLVQFGRACFSLPKVHDAEVGGW
jgi:hypothetical protein